jgi:hypothetical protein
VLMRGTHFGSQGVAEEEQGVQAILPEELPGEADHPCPLVGGFKIEIDCIALE